MSATFTEFLREQAEKRKSRDTDRQRVLDDWIEALKRLYAQMEGWLRSSDPDGILNIEKEENWEVEEEGLGKYSVPRLDIRGLGRWVGVVPKARFTVASAHPPQKASSGRPIGRVDITNEVRRFVLYRFPSAEGDLWLIDDQKNPPSVLDQAAFESALMSYLQ
ncbi:Hypothetical conserved protein OS=Candidatus Acetothermus autotrophicum GN=HGMM_OP3C474 PE=4 SV=1 [Gemmataceae bacterium]|nr:Hypothetical conserved protein OS=Candidatus Acetothermus autotrophicum GN=HGMM_OP3C474 PE=4 SV=1 [Gemmataceae bacterium]VTT97427.1 Hypothetical conserved protein OS=Candidatus Acetothermus autotrophicum GN=HGMM_OP3C474 PE=4 SV=1 [Gemmataceae bacterium]